MLALVLLFCALATTQGATAELNLANLQKHSINVSFPENNVSSTSRYHLAAEYDSGYLIFNVSTLKEGSTHYHAHIRAVPFYNTSEKFWSSEVHLAQFYPNGEESRLYQFNMTEVIRNLNNYGPGPCEKLSPLGNEVACRFNFSVASKWISLFVSIKNPLGEQPTLKLLGPSASDSEETPEFSWSEYWRVSNLIKKAELHVLFNEPKSIMELKWNGSINGSEDFMKLKPIKISFKSEKYNTTTVWKGLSTLQPTSYMFMSDYLFSEKDCQVWCEISLILTDPESPGSFYPVQILKYRNPNTIRNFLIVGIAITFAFLVVFVCWITRTRRNKRRSLTEMSQFTDIAKAPATHYVIYHASHGQQQPYQYPAQKNFFTRK